MSDCTMDLSIKTSVTIPSQYPHNTTLQYHVTFSSLYHATISSIILCIFSWCFHIPNKFPSFTLRSQGVPNMFPCTFQCVSATFQYVSKKFDCVHTLFPTQSRCHYIATRLLHEYRVHITISCHKSQFISVDHQKLNENKNRSQILAHMHSQRLTLISIFR